MLSTCRKNPTNLISLSSKTLAQRATMERALSFRHMPTGHEPNVSGSSGGCTSPVLVCQWPACKCNQRPRVLYNRTNVDFRYAGYANSVIGSIIANEGFIRYFATVTDPDTGKPALDSQHISLWAACYFVSAILIQTIAPVTADRFGRKFNMWCITFFLTLVSNDLSINTLGTCLLIIPNAVHYSPSHRPELVGSVDRQVGRRLCGRYDGNVLHGLHV